MNGEERPYSCNLAGDLFLPDFILNFVARRRIEETYWSVRVNLTQAELRVANQLPNRF
jgi:hypothetical protein